MNDFPLGIFIIVKWYDGRFAAARVDAELGIKVRWGS